MAKELAIYEDFDITSLMSPLFMMVMLLVVMSILPSITTTTTQAQQYYSAQAYTGLTDERSLNATPTMQWLNLISAPPYNPWITAYFFNNGPHSAFIAINNPDELYQLAKGEEKRVDMTGASRRIEFVFYKSNKGERALVRGIGKY